ncbi:MAG: hypothetical protein EON54_08660 [Alcaligenaceae bacterium]|nr:MAG: hypothetical protein EON54_08660 [Alcaligenaceae bacterium]
MKTAALLASLTFLFVAVPAIADAASNARTAPEVRAARKHHTPRSLTSDSFAAYPADTQSHPTFGYGVGDNSRNQTW